jgi:PAS domain S-box-containing protein
MPSEYLSAVIDSIGNPIFVKDGQHRFVFANDAACEMLGIRRELWLGRTDYELFPKEQADIFREHDLRLREAGGRDVNEEQITDAQGETRTIVTTKTLYVGETGEKYIVGVIHDITERKRLENVVKEAEEKYRTIFENANIGIYQTTTDGRIVIANSALARMWGGDSPQELVDYVDASREFYLSAQEFKRIRELCLKDGFVDHYETQLLRKDKTARWVSVNMSITEDGQGRVVYLEGTIEDIDERKRAVEATHQSEQTLRSLIDATREPLLLIDREGTILVANEVLAERFGKTARELVGTCQYDYFPPEVAARRKKRSTTRWSAQVPQSIFRTNGPGGPSSLTAIPSSTTKE